MTDRLARRQRTERVKRGNLFVTVEPLAAWELGEIRQAAAAMILRTFGNKPNCPKRPRRAILASSQSMIRIAKEKLGAFA
jgi:hypothetical protein